MIPSSITHDGRVLERHAAWPDSAHRALTAWRVGETAAVLPGQWFADPAERDLVAGQTLGSVQVGDGVLIHPRGADRVLVGLADLTSRSGSELVVHRPERLALVHRPHPDDPARQAMSVAAPARIRERLRSGEPRLTETEGGPLQVLRTLPTHTGQDGADGVILDRPPGDSLFSMWNDQRWGRAALGRVWASAGLALRRLHDGPSAGLPVYTAESEVELTRQQLSDAYALGSCPGWTRSPCSTASSTRIPARSGCCTGGSRTGPCSPRAGTGSSWSRRPGSARANAPATSPRS